MLVFAPARQVRDDPGLVLQIGLDLEQVVGATGAIGRLCAMEHQSLAAVCDDLRQHRHQCVVVRDLCLLDQAEVRTR